MCVVLCVRVYVSVPNLTTWVQGGGWLPNFGINEKSMSLTSTYSRLASVVLDDVLGPLRVASNA